MILLSQRAHQMIQLAVHKEPQLEVLGFGKGKIVDNGVVITDIMIPKQEVAGATTDLEEGNLILWMETLARMGGTLADWPLWWHSHCNMSTSPSGTDEATLERLVESVPELGWFTGLVTNTKGEYHGWVELLKPFSASFKLPVVVAQPHMDGIVEQVNEMMEHVTRKTWAAPASWKGGQYSANPLAYGGNHGLLPDGEDDSVLALIDYSEANWHEQLHLFGQYPRICGECAIEDTQTDAGKLNPPNQPPPVAAQADTKKSKRQRKAERKAGK